MTSSHDLSAHPDGATPPGPSAARPHRRRAAALLAAAAPLALHHRRPGRHRSQDPRIGRGL